eukprot:gb/GECG01009880.1/.p1 GENE.gb/GECG01009880.1/~~gb/GECG01009880.1/.p1  ORF type:complete len:124 (+),score=8.43 gb/GECG01009880.1/:1-372(+)
MSKPRSVRTGVGLKKLLPTGTGIYVGPRGASVYSGNRGELDPSLESSSTFIPASVSIGEALRAVLDDATSVRSPDILLNILETICRKYVYQDTGFHNNRRLNFGRVLGNYKKEIWGARAGSLP